MSNDRGENQHGFFLHLQLLCILNTVNIEELGEKVCLRMNLLANRLL